MAATKAGRAKTEAGKSAVGKSAAPKEEPTCPPPVAAAESDDGEGNLTALAAARVPAEAGAALTCRQLVAVMAVKGYWRSPGGKTPYATLRAAIGAEINKKGDAARFRKTAPGRFAAAGAPGTLPPGTGRPRAVGQKRAGGTGARTAPAVG